MNDRRTAFVVEKCRLLLFHILEEMTATLIRLWQAALPTFGDRQ